MSVQKTVRWGGEKVAGNTILLTKRKRVRERWKCKRALIEELTAVEKQAAHMQTVATLCKITKALAGVKLWRSNERCRRVVVTSVDKANTTLENIFRDHPQQVTGLYSEGSVVQGFERITILQVWWAFRTIGQAPQQKWCLLVAG